MGDAPVDKDFLRQFNELREDVRVLRSRAAGVAPGAAGAGNLMAACYAKGPNGDAGFLSGQMIDDTDDLSTVIRWSEVEYEYGGDFHGGGAPSSLVAPVSGWAIITGWVRLGGLSGWPVATDAKMDVQLITGDRYPGADPFDPSDTGTWDFHEHHHFPEDPGTNNTFVGGAWQMWVPEGCKFALRISDLNPAETDVYAEQSRSRLCVAIFGGLPDQEF